MLNAIFTTQGKQIVEVIVPNGFLFNERLLVIMISNLLFFRLILFVTELVQL